MNNMHRNAEAEKFARRGPLLNRPSRVLINQDLEQNSSVEFSTLHKGWPLSAIFSASGREKGEGTGGENRSFGSLPERGLRGTIQWRPEARK